MIIVNSLRFLAIILLVIILIVKELPFKPLFKDVMIQFYLAVTCMLFLLLVDNIFGFILSICLLSIYFRIYTSEFNKKENASCIYEIIDPFPSKTVKELSNLSKINIIFITYF
jgi:Ca2+/Na+ antiporter